MSIVFVNEYAGFKGGVEQNIFLTARALKERGYTCHLLHWKEGTEVEEYGTVFESTHRYHSEEGLKALVGALSPTALYLHRVESVLPFLHLGIRTVRMVHDHDLCCPRRHKYKVGTHKVCEHAAGARCWVDLAFLERQEGGLKFRNLFRHLTEMRRNQKLDKLLVGSRSMQKELFTNGFSSSQVEIVPPAVPAPNLSTDRPFSSEDEPPTILFVGQMIRGKGPDLLLRAAALLNCDFRLVMVGRGNWLEHLKGLACSLGLERKVQWKGWVSPQELDSYYAAARAVAVPSRWAEPFGMVGLEAMHRARPVVAFRVGGIPDWLDHEVTGFLATPPSVTEFSSYLGKLLEDPGLAARLGRNGLAKVNREYSFGDYIARLENLLHPYNEEVLAG